MISKVKNFFVQHKLFVTAILLFSIIFLVYLVYCPEWFFDGEDYGIIFRAAQAAGLKDYLDFFIHGNMCNSCPAFFIDRPENLIPINTYYRPLWQIVDALRFAFFGLQPYAYFITGIAVHALNATLVMYVIHVITKNLPLSFVCSLFFAFHPLLHGWLGKIDMQQHQFTLLLILLALIFFLKSLHHPTKLILLSAYLLYLASLLMRETFIVLPFMLLGIFWLITDQALLTFYVIPASERGSRTFILAYFLDSLFRGNDIVAAKVNRTQSTMHKLGNLILGCCTIAGIYIVMRTVNCWYLAGTQQNLFPINIISLPHNICAHAKHFLFFLYDFFWSQWFALGTYEFFCVHNVLFIYRIIKIVFIATVATLCITNTHKKLLFFCLCSILTLLWPLLIISYGGYRYFYETLPLCALGLAVLIQFSTITRQALVRRCIYVVLCFCISMNGLRVISSMRAIMQTPQHITMALRTFKNMQGTKYLNTPLFIFNSPSPLIATGLIQAVQLYNISNAKPLYFFAGFSINSDLTAQEIQHFIMVNKTNNGLRFISRNRDLAAFYILPDQVMYEQKHFYIEQTIIHQCSKNKISDIEFIFKQGYFDPQMKVLALFLAEKCFIEMPCV